LHLQTACSDKNSEATEEHAFRPAQQGWVEAPVFRPVNNDPNGLGFSPGIFRSESLEPLRLQLKHLQIVILTTNARACPERSEGKNLKQCIGEPRLLEILRLRLRMTLLF
jgi:hypothetical protein